MKKVIILLCFLSTLGSIVAQHHHFRVYSLEEGLPQSELWDILQDSRKNLWVATNGGGVCRFTGSNFITYNQKDGLADGQVGRIFEDSKSNLWFIGFRAVSVYDGHKFKNYNQSKGFIPGRFFQIAESKDKKIWIFSLTENTKRSVLYFEKDSFIDFSAKYPELTTNNIVIGIFTTRDSTLLISTRNGIYEVQNNKPVASPFQSIFKGSIAIPLLQDRYNRLWFATREQSTQNGKLYQYENNKLTEIVLPPDIIPLQMTRLTLDHNNNLWFIHQQEVIRYDGTTYHRYNEANGLPVNTITDILEDHEGNIWLGSRGKGLIRYAGALFTYFDTSDGLSHNIVRSIHQDKDGNYWFSGWDGSISIYDGKRITRLQDKQLRGNILVNHICTNADGNVLVCTSIGVFEYDGKKLIEKNKDLGLDDGVPVNFLTVSGNETWIAITGGGVMKHTKEKNISYTTQNGLISNIVYHILKTKKGDVWICTEYGLTRITGDSVLRYGTNQGLNNELILQSAEDKFGKIWFCTFGGGLTVFSNNKFTHITTDNGLSSNIVYSVLCDQKGNIWAGTQLGINKISLNEKGEVADIKQYGKHEGFVGVEPNGLAIYEDRQGYLWFGTLNGVFRFNQQEDLPNTNSPYVQITNLRLYYQNVDWESKEYCKMYQQLASWMPLPVNLILPYKKNHVSFDFEALSYRTPEKIKYQWQLAGLDADWSPASSNTQAVYPNLPAGKYTFMVRACNEDGIWSAKPTSYSFVIKTPMWRTWTFWLMVISFLLGIIYTLFRLRLKSIEAKKEELEKLVEAKTAQIRKQNQEILRKNAELQQNREEIMAQTENLQKAYNDITIQKQQIEEKNAELLELNDEKNHLIGIVAHDLRNPLTTSLTIANVMKDEAEQYSEDDRENLNYLVEALERMNRMITQILDVRKIESKQFNITWEMVDLSVILQQVIQQFTGKALAKNIKINFQFENVKFYSQLDRSYASQVFENLVSNALKFSPTESEIYITIQEIANRNRVEVRDEGPGISAEDQQKLFRKFQRLSAKPTAGEKSTGLGLSIVKKYVEVMNGQVWCESELDKGTSFIVEFEKYDN